MATQLGARALQGGCKLPGLRVSRVAFDSQGSGVVESLRFGFVGVDLVGASTCV